MDGCTVPDLYTLTALSENVLYDIGLRQYAVVRFVQESTHHFHTGRWLRHYISEITCPVLTDSSQAKAIRRLLMASCIWSVRSRSSCMAFRK